MRQPWPIRNWPQPFLHGRQARTEDVERIQAPLLLIHYAELDTRHQRGLARHEAALKEHGKIMKPTSIPGEPRLPQRLDPALR